LSITLPDGTTETVLVLQVYLLFREGDLRGDATLMAGRDIVLTPPSASQNNGATCSSYISGVSRVDAGSLNMQAGRDVTLTAAQVAPPRTACACKRAGARYQATCKNSWG
jgi:hypothetical protein